LINARKRETQADLMRKNRARERDLEIPAVENPKRRASAKRSLRYFGKTYFPHLYYLKPAKFQSERIKKMEFLIRYGGMAADAEPRGSGKTTDAVVAAIWALLNGLREHFLVIRANGPEATEIISDIKLELETNDLLLADYPEACVPVRALEGAPQRAGRQTVNGARTRIQYHGDCIVLPMIEGSVSSGAVCSVAGIGGKIRGRKINLKRPRKGSGFRWHQDSPYWTHACDHVDLLPNVLISLDDPDEENGCFRVVRGSHREGCLPGIQDDTTLGVLFTDPDHFDEANQVPAIVPAGSLVFFNPHAVHGSEPNVSERPRRAMVLTYQPAGNRMFKIDATRNAGA